MKIFILFFFFLFYQTSCLTQPSTVKQGDSPAVASHEPGLNGGQFDTSSKTIHVLVALCDNKYQGIVPVPAKIGNGQDPANNLYWGCAFGISTYFKYSPQWTLIRQYGVNDTLLQRLVFKHNRSNYYLVADAFNGKHIRQCTIEFLKNCAGIRKDTVQTKGKAIGINGNASLVAYIGHDGLMDFSLPEKFNNRDAKKRDAIVLACISKVFFSKHLAATGAQPLLWSTGLMSPEAYTLHDALEAYINNAGDEAIRMAAAKAYSKYQKCTVKAASRLLVTGW
jgi:hypothetical protein